MPDIDKCLRPEIRSRILNALWNALYPDGSPRPKGWVPDPKIIADLPLDVVSGLGTLGQKLVRSWLEQRGYARPARRRRAPYKAS